MFATNGGLFLEGGEVLVMAIVGFHVWHLLFTEIFHEAPYSNL